MAKNHIRLGQDANLFHFTDEGDVIISNGAVIINRLKDYLSLSLRTRGYKDVITPPLYSNDMYKVYSEDMPPAPIPPDNTVDNWEDVVNMQNTDNEHQEDLIDVTSDVMNNSPTENVEEPLSQETNVIEEVDNIIKEDPDKIVDEVMEVETPSFHEEIVVEDTETQKTLDSKYFIETLKEDTDNTMELDDDSTIENASDTVTFRAHNKLGHALVFKNNVVSYDQLPYRVFESNEVYGMITSSDGLFNQRSYHVVEGTSYCSEKDIQDEINPLIKFIQEFYQSFGFEFKAEVFIDETSDMGRNTGCILTNCLSKFHENIDVVVSSEASRIQFSVRNINENWMPCGFIELDSKLSLDLELVYYNKNGEQQHPYIVRHQIVGSLERFFGLILEQTQGNLPYWLALKQICVIPVKCDPCSESTFKYLRFLDKMFYEHTLTADISNGSFSAKVQRAKNEGYHYIFIIGDNEVKNNQITYLKNGELKGRHNIKHVFETIPTENYSFMTDLITDKKEEVIKIMG